jgi:guanylate kinase
MTEKIIVISGPSGSGKSTIAKALLSEFHLLEFSVSSTTRTKRAYETEGKITISSLKKNSNS